MALSGGRVDVEVGVTLTGEARRLVALQEAVKYVGTWKNNSPTADSVVGFAKTFESYLEGAKP
ncbi:hypothetical protein SEA_SUCHA_56 [Microbacterium phage Sucha]|nr:hypothetical protein SEA_SUCHA_56 [Microbacterium phage Sucha]